MRRHTNLRLPMLGAALLAALSLVAGAYYALAQVFGHVTNAIRPIDVNALEGGLLAVVGALGAAFLVCAFITAIRHANHETMLSLEAA